MATVEARLWRVRDYSDALIVRNIRNECRDYMTNDSKYITVKAQTQWWKEIKADPTWQVYLFIDDGKEVGYGIVRYREGRHWVTGGLIESARGRGLGRILFARLTEIAAKDFHAYLEVRKDNTRAINLYRSLGYRYLGEPREGVLLMRTSPG